MNNSVLKMTNLVIFQVWNWLTFKRLVDRESTSKKRPVSNLWVACTFARLAYRLPWSIYSRWAAQENVKVNYPWLFLTISRGRRCSSPRRRHRSQRTKAHLVYSHWRLCVNYSELCTHLFSYLLICWVEVCGMPVSYTHLTLPTILRV